MYYDYTSEALMVYTGSTWNKYLPEGQVQEIDRQEGGVFFISYPQTNEYVDYNLPYNLLEYLF